MSATVDLGLTSAMCNKNRRVVLVPSHTAVFTSVHFLFLSPFHVSVRERRRRCPRQVPQYTRANQECVSTCLAYLRTVTICRSIVIRLAAFIVVALVVTDTKRDQLTLPHTNQRVHHPLQVNINGRARHYHRPAQGGMLRYLEVLPQALQRGTAVAHASRVRVCCNSDDASARQGRKIILLELHGTQASESAMHHQLP